jgi:hypothetical protein
MFRGSMPTLTERGPKAILPGVSVANGTFILFVRVEPYRGKLHEGEYAAMAPVPDCRAGVKSKAKYGAGAKDKGN